MTLYSKVLIYPEGDRQEIYHNLHINQLVDLNGVPLRLPLKTDKQIAFRIFRISNKVTRGEEIKEFHLEALSRFDLARYMGDDLY